MTTEVYPWWLDSGVGALVAADTGPLPAARAAPAAPTGAAPVPAGGTLAAGPPPHAASSTAMQRPTPRARVIPASHHRFIVSPIPPSARGPPAPASATGPPDRRGRPPGNGWCALGQVLLCAPGDPRPHRPAPRLAPSVADPCQRRDAGPATNASRRRTALLSCRSEER